MKKIAVVYWSGTGNTEAMASHVEAGAKSCGAEVSVFSVEDFNAAQVANFDAFAFGCPSMGEEELEDTTFEPVFAACETQLSGKALALFGSYGWGDGEWMRNWEDRCKKKGLTLACDSVICCEAPDDEAAAALNALGKALCA